MTDGSTRDGELRETTAPTIELPDPDIIDPEDLRAAWPYAPGESPYRVKATVYEAFWRWLDEGLGRPALYHALPDDYAEFLRSTEQNGGWVDSFPHFVASVTAAEVAGLSWREGVEERSRRFANRDRSSFVKLVISMVSPAMVLQAAPRLSVRYFDYGAVRSDVRPGHGTLRFHGVPVPLHPWHAQMAKSYLREAVTSVDGRDVQITITTRAGGRDPEGVDLVDSTIQVRWT